MVTFGDSMDDKSIPVLKDREEIGHVQWHKEMCFVFTGERFARLSETEWEAIAKKMEAVRTNGWKKF